MATQGNGFQFDYIKYQTKGISVDQLDMLAKSVFSADGGTNWLSAIWGGLKLGFAIAYIFARAKLVDEQMQIEKQQYEVSQTDGNQNEVNNQDPPPLSPPPAK